MCFIMFQFVYNDFKALLGTPLRVYHNKNNPLMFHVKDDKPEGVARGVYHL